MPFTTGVFPVHGITFKIGTLGRASAAIDMKTIANMETFSMSIDANIEEWTPMDTAGWIKRMVTGKGLTIGLNGKRTVGDDGNDYVADKALAVGSDCESKFEMIFPDGNGLAFDCVINVTNSGGGDSTNVGGLELEIQSDGKPTPIVAP